MAVSCQVWVGSAHYNQAHGPGLDISLEYLREEQVRRTLNLISGEDLAASVPPGTQAGPGEGSDLELLDAYSRAIVKVPHRRAGDPQRHPGPGTPGPAGAASGGQSLRMLNRPALVGSVSRSLTVSPIREWG